MKKFSIYFLVIMFLFVTGCRTNASKEMITLEDFESISVNSNFMVVDTGEEYSDANYIVGAKKATLGNIEIEMLEYTDIASAETVHADHIDSFNLLKATGAYEIKDEGNNYYKYELVSNGYFMVSVRVENTLIYCKTLLNNKETVEDVFEKYGY